MEYFIIHKYYENGDSIIKVLSQVNTSDAMVVVYLRYSPHHNVYNIDTCTMDEFLEWFYPNELINFEFENIKSEDIL